MNGSFSDILIFEPSTAISGAMASPDTKTKILVVEDEDDVRKLMALHLKREGFEIFEAANGETALEILSREKIHLAILDWMLPGMSGFEICKHLQRRVPVLMVTAKTDSNDIVSALDAGADDYVTKPFQIPVFMARTRALLRRSAEPVKTTYFEVGRLKVDTVAYTAECSGDKLHLTPSEFKALVSLLENEDRILSRTKLMTLVQGEGIKVTDRAIDTLIFGLRKNLGFCSPLIETVRGVGYRLRVPSGLLGQTATD